MTSDPGLSPADITNASFETKRRGYDPDAVKAHLRAAASTVTSLEAQIAELTSRVDGLTVDVAAAKEEAAVAGQNPIELDEEQLANRIGQDAARVLSEARAAATDRIAEAEREAETIISGAEEVYATRSRQADEEAARIRARADEQAAVRAQEAEAAAADLMSSAEADLELVRSEVDSGRETADAEASRIIQEAEIARRQILGDLLRRRGAAKRQIEQLRAGRERLLASHEAVRRALDEITEELNVSMSEARAAAKTAGHSISDGTIAELEAEIETARLTGLLDTGPVPVVRSAALPTSSSANRQAEEPAVNDVDPEESEPESPKASTEAEEAEPEVEEPEAAVAQGDSDGDDTNDGDSNDGDDGDDGDDANPEAELSNVVQLDSARAEVDTATHPAKGRNATTSLGNKSVSDSTPEASKSPSKPQELAAVSEAADDRDDSVGDLFASLRSESEPPPATPKKSKSAASATKKTAAKKKSSSNRAKKMAPAKSAAKKPTEELVDSSALARRLKRVLADEQSRAMSTLKAAEEFPDLDELLNPDSAHREPYWDEVLGQLDDPGLAGDAAGAAIDSLIATIRRRVGEALIAADGDGDAAVSSLRSIYREIKTQQVPEAADMVCQSLLASA